MRAGGRGSDLQHHVVVDARAGAVPRHVPRVEGGGDGARRIARGRGRAVRHPRRSRSCPVRSRPRCCARRPTGRRPRPNTPSTTSWRSGCGKGARASATRTRRRRKRPAGSSTRSATTTARCATAATTQRGDARRLERHEQRAVGARDVEVVLVITGLAHTALHVADVEAAVRVVPRRARPGRAVAAVSHGGRRRSRVTWASSCPRRSW